MTQQMTHFPKPGMHLPGPIENASAQAASVRRDEAERKRIERAERRAAGTPDPRVVDTAIVAALIETLAKGHAATRIRAKGTTKGFLVGLEPLMRDALANLVHGRGVSHDAAIDALQKRLRLV